MYARHASCILESFLVALRQLTQLPRYRPGGQTHCGNVPLARRAPIKAGGDNGLATIDECRAALQTLAARMEAHAEEVRGKIDLDRPIACRITDLDVAFHGHLTDGRLVGLTDGDDPAAKITLRASSDDLVALVNGQLDFPRALTSGRVSVKANPFDLIKLRKLL
jgi:putative sterol carrier protein